jgi:hypothetical protein
MEKSDKESLLCALRICSSDVHIVSCVCCVGRSVCARGDVAQGTRSHSRGVSERAQREIGPTLTQPRAQCCMESNPTDLKFIRIFRRVSGSEIDNNSLSLRQGRLRLFSLSPDANTPTGCAAEERERWRFSTPSSRRPPPPQSGPADKLSSHSIWVIPGWGLESLLCNPPGRAQIRYFRLEVWSLNWY